MFKIGVNLSKKKTNMVFDFISKVVKYSFTGISFVSYLNGILRNYFDQVYRSVWYKKVSLAKITIGTVRLLVDLKLI